MGEGGTGLQKTPDQGVGGRKQMWVIGLEQDSSQHQGSGAMGPIIRRVNKCPQIRVME